MQPEENKWLALPQEIHPPAINSHLEELGALVRSTECLRFFVLSMEHSISPNGRLRWWLKVNCCLCAWLFIPAILLMPVISLVLWQVDGWLSMLLSITIKLIVISVVIMAVIRCLQHRLKHFPSSSQGSSQRRK